MNLAGWILGPQLLGVIFFIMGLILFCFPPKHINKWYGYRMLSSQKNQETWDEANRYSAVYMIKCGAVIFIVGLVITGILNALLIPFKIKQIVTVCLLICAGMIPPLLSIFATEKHLRRTFDTKQK